MKKAYWIFDNIFGRNICVFVGSYKQAMAFGKQNKHFSQISSKESWEESKLAGSSGETWSWEDQQDFFIWLKEFGGSENDIATLSHELIHVAKRIIKNTQIQDKSESGELLAYIHSAYLRHFLTELSERV